MILTGWRVSDPEYAKTPSQMMSGEGAYLHGGRWNTKGNRVVYLGTSLAQAAMEVLVHLRNQQVLLTYHKLDVAFDDTLLTEIRIEDLPADWAAPNMEPDTQEVGDYWLQDELSVILKVPSAALFGEYNYLFNPNHPDANQVAFGSIETFEFDPRLVKTPVRQEK